MGSINQNQYKGSSTKSEGTQHIINDGKKLASDILEEGKNKWSHIESDLKEYSDQIAQKVNEKPIKSLLIAGGIGFILSRLLK